MTRSVQGWGCKCAPLSAGPCHPVSRHGLTPEERAVGQPCGKDWEPAASVSRAGRCSRLDWCAFSAAALLAGLGESLAQGEGCITGKMLLIEETGLQL